MKITLKRQYSDDVTNATNANALIPARRKKVRWTSEEEEALKNGVNKHGKGKWKNIKKDPEFEPYFTTRTNVDLKDKWRNMTGEISSRPKFKKAAVPTTPYWEKPESSCFYPGERVFGGPELDWFGIPRKQDTHDEANSGGESTMSGKYHGESTISNNTGGSVGSVETSSDEVNSSDESTTSENSGDSEGSVEISSHEINSAGIHDPISVYTDEVQSSGTKNLSNFQLSILPEGNTSRPSFNLSIPQKGNNDVKADNNYQRARNQTGQQQHMSSDKSVEEHLSTLRRLRGQFSGQRMPLKRDKSTDRQSENFEYEYLTNPYVREQTGRQSANVRYEYQANPYLCEQTDRQSANFGYEYETYPYMREQRNNRQTETENTARYFLEEENY